MYWWARRPGQNSILLDLMYHRFLELTFPACNPEKFPACWCLICNPAGLLELDMLRSEIIKAPQEVTESKKFVMHRCPNRRPEKAFFFRKGRSRLTQTIDGDCMSEFRTLCSMCATLGPCWEDVIPGHCDVGGFY
jgi:hypothetical protein